MKRHSKSDLALEGYRVLDLSEGHCLICGELLAQLGTEVIKIEGPGGSPSRNIGPFYKDDIHSEKSLFWFVYNAGKKSITLDIETNDGQEIFKELSKTADFIIESFSPGYMDELGLGYKVLSEINPRLILTSITPYGQRGPTAHYKASDLVLWSLGGFTYICGDPDLPPVGPSIPLAFHNAGTAAMSASLVAHWDRELTGEGQHVDVSAEWCIYLLVSMIGPYWDFMKFIQTRGGDSWVWPGGTTMRMCFPCKDGYIYCHIWGGADPGFINSNQELINWMDEEGMAPDWLKKFDFMRDYAAEKLTPELSNRVNEPFIKFFSTKTKQELFDRAIKHRIILAPVNDTKDVLEDPNLASHLADREFWNVVEHPELSDSLLYPGFPIRMSGTPSKIRRRAPFIGEHNNQIYKGELGFSKEGLIFLKQAKVI
jgi:crotonobetainyl-CoA:carnitine CoA-transferase CaiB-like acyl-CoA transferase